MPGVPAVLSLRAPGLCLSPGIWEGDDCPQPCSCPSPSLHQDPLCDWHLLPTTLLPSPGAAVRHRNVPWLLQPKGSGWSRAAWRERGTAGLLQRPLCCRDVQGLGRGRAGQRSRRWCHGRGVAGAAGCRLGEPGWLGLQARGAWPCLGRTCLQQGLCPAPEHHRGGVQPAETSAPSQIGRTMLPAEGPGQHFTFKPWDEEFGGAKPCWWEARAADSLPRAAGQFAGLCPGTLPTGAAPQAP